MSEREPVGVIGVGWVGLVTAACFAELEEGSPFEPLAASRGVPGSALTLFAGSGWWPVVDQLSRTPESLARSFAAALRTGVVDVLVVDDELAHRMLTRRRSR